MFQSILEAFASNALPLSAGVLSVAVALLPRIIMKLIGGNSEPEVRISLDENDIKLNAKDIAEIQKMLDQLLKDKAELARLEAELDSLEKEIAAHRDQKKALNAASPEKTEF